jgi:hypothetical protein
MPFGNFWCLNGFFRFGCGIDCFGCVIVRFYFIFFSVLLLSVVEVGEIFLWFRCCYKYYANRIAT